MPVRPSSVTRSAASSSRPSLPRSATHTSGNSSPLARCTVISRTASRSSASSGACPSPRLHQVALGHEVDEAAQVAALVGLELARHPHELAHVGHPPPALGQRQQVAVVARARDRPVDQRLQRHPRRRRAVLAEAVARTPRSSSSCWPPQQPGQPVVLGHDPPDAPRARALGARGQHHQRVQRQPAQRRGQHRVQRQLVQRVGQRGQVGAQVGHLLLGPVAAPAQHVGVDAAVLERALVHAHVGGGAQQQHAVAVGERPARAGQLVDPLGQQPRLGLAPDGHVGGAEACRTAGRRPPSGREALLPALWLAVASPAAPRTARPAAAGRARPGRSTRASKSSPHSPSKIMSTASSTSPRLRKFTVIRSARPAARAASARWRRKTRTSAWRKP